MASPKFLVVDDSLTMRRIFVNVLKSLGYENVIEAEHGKQALEKLLTEGADFLITDWNMPEMSGLELVKAVRANPALENLPVLMVTTRGYAADVIEAMKARVNNYIVKPFTAPVLKEKIELVLKSVAAAH